MSLQTASNMASGFELVTRINAEARAAGVADSVVQFDNISTHAQYRVPYEVTSRAIHRGDRVLDWVCGNGHFSRLLEHLGAQITGYSFEPPPRSMAGSPNFRFVAGSEADPRSLPFANASFDAAVGVGVLEHVWETGGNEPASLAELARVVKPGGTLLTFHLPNEGGWIEKVVHGLKLSKHFHKRKFNEAEIRSLWSAAASVTEIGLYNALPRSELKVLPGAVKQSRLFARSYDLLDDTLGAVLPRVATNFYIVARRGKD